MLNNEPLIEIPLHLTRKLVMLIFSQILLGINLKSVDITEMFYIWSNMCVHYICFTLIKL